MRQPEQGGHERGPLDQVSTVAGDAARMVQSAISESVKPRLRGWLHAGAFPVVLIASIALVVSTDDPKARWACVVFGASASLLFGISALYHRGRWSPRTTMLLKRFDHSNIFLIIAGSYTPLTLLLLPPGKAETLLLVVWIGALVGIALRVVWGGAPRWVFVPLYVVLGWVAIAYLPDFRTSGGPLILALVIAGGVLYTLGAAVFAFQRPNPSPRWFGFHEVFHAFTVLAFGAHFVAISAAVATV